MRKHTQIQKEERLEIAILLEKGYTYRAIARVLKRSPNTISYEVSENSVRGIYDPHKAHHKAYVRRKYSKYEAMKVVEDKELRRYVEAKIQSDWSPEQIAGRIRYVDTHIPSVSYGVIYKYVRSVYGRVLEQRLRYYRRKSGSKRSKTVQLEGRRFIDKRPKIVDTKKRYGDWEGDFIVSGKSGKGVLLVLYERKSQYVIIRRLMSRDSVLVNAYLYEIMRGLVYFNSLTLDNDISFRRHEELSRTIGAPVYFCHPYHSWEKGGVENMNKLIRQYVPKRSDISKYNISFLRNIERKLNTRPRKGLRYRTPYEVMNRNNQLKYDVYDIQRSIQKQKTPVS